MEDLDPNGMSNGWVDRGTSTEGEGSAVEELEVRVCIACCSVICEMFFRLAFRKVGWNLS